MSIKRMQKLFGWAGAVCLVATFASTAFAKNNLNCTIVDETGKPLAKQEVILVPVSGGKETKRKTNDQGVAEFKGLDDGSYQVRGAIDGYVIGKSAPIQLSGNSTQTCTYKIASVSYANGLLQEVLNLTRQRKFTEAEERGKRAIELLPEESGAYYVLAVAYASAGKETEGAAAIQKAAELNPEKYKETVQVVRLTAIGAQADALLAKNDLDGAMKKYEAMLAIKPDESTVFYNMAVAYGRANKFDQALKSIDKAIELKPDDLEVQQMKIKLQDMYLKAMDKKLEK